MTATQPMGLMTLGDLTATVPPLTAVVVASGLGLWLVRPWLALDLFGSLVVFYAFICASASLMLKILQTTHPLLDGTYAVERDPGVFETWKARTFLTSTCLTIPYQFGLIPPALRKLLLRLLGAHMSASGPASTTAYVTDPHRFEMGPDSFLQMNCMILPAVINPGELHLGTIRLADSVNIGPLSMLLAGVTIGSHATVEPMSLVAENTHIGAGETWGGIPAQRR